MSAEDMLNDELNFQIATTLLKECEPSISDAAIKIIWEKCQGNPWDAVPLLRILKCFGWEMPA